MRYITATLGAMFMFVAVFILSAFLYPFLPKILVQRVALGGLATNNVVGLLLALAAAAASVRGTLKHYREKDRRREAAASSKGASPGPT